MSTPNPWTVVPASDYERHMGPEGADQLGPLSAAFQEAYLAAQPDTVLLLGCATGNGLEHVDPAVTRRVVGVDVNLQYLGVARQRYFHLGPRLELFCNDVLSFKATEPGGFQLVHAALVFEYVQAEALARRMAEWLSDRGTAVVVLQRPGGEGPEAPSRAMQIIQKAMHLVDPEALTALFAGHGLHRRREAVVPLRQGRSFWVGHFGRAAR
jgi:SAM-dependent methyltransferase